MEFDWLRLIEFLVATLIIGGLIFIVVRQAFALQKTKTALQNERQEKFVIYGELQTLKDSTKVNDKDFIKFLSDSRDDAFSYIEDVQEKIRGLIVAWNYHTTQMPPDGSSEKKLHDAYVELVAMLPEDTKND